MATIFREGKIFLKIVKSTLLRYPMAQKLRQNRSISHVKEIETTLCFPIFLAKIRKNKMAAIFGEGNFFENCQ